MVSWTRDCLVTKLCRGSGLLHSLGRKDAVVDNKSGNIGRNMTLLAIGSAF